MPIAKILARSFAPVNAVGNAFQYGFFVITFCTGGVLLGHRYGAWQGTSAVLALALLLVFRGAVVTQREIDRFAATHPRLVLAGVEHAEEKWRVKVQRILWPEMKKSEGYELLPRRFARIQIANDPPPGTPGEGAIDLTARLTFACGPSWSKTVDGHWCRHGKGPTDEDAVWNPPIDLPANGQSQALDIAMQDPEDGATYIFNDLNRKVFDGRLPAHTLGGGPCLVTVILRASNTPRPTTFTFSLHLGGKDDPMRLEGVEED